MEFWIHTGQLGAASHNNFPNVLAKLEETAAQEQAKGAFAN